MPNRPETHRPGALPSDYRPPAPPTSEAKAAADKIRSSYRWQKLRAIVRKDYPTCQHPLCDGKGRRAAQLVHHILSVLAYPHLAYTVSNLVPLCRPCHNEIERLESEGKSTAGIFAAFQAKRDDGVQYFG